MLNQEYHKAVLTSDIAIALDVLTVIEALPQS